MQQAGWALPILLKAGSLEGSSEYTHLSHLSGCGIPSIELTIDWVSIYCNPEISVSSAHVLNLPVSHHQNSAVLHSVLKILCPVFLDP